MKQSRARFAVTGQLDDDGLGKIADGSMGPHEYVWPDPLHPAERLFMKLYHGSNIQIS